MSSVKLHIVLPSLHNFYEESNLDEVHHRWEHYNSYNDPSWKGLSILETEKSKFSYTKGLDTLEALEKDSLDLGGYKHKYKWDDFDGDDMDFDRYTEGLAPMKKRIRTCGIGSGKFITIHVNISEFGGTTANEMLCKAYTAIRIIDLLEELGYRVGVTVFDDTGYLGSTKNGDYIEFLRVEVPVKKFDEPLLRPLILTCISPWMERHHMFKFHSAKFKVDQGMGRAAQGDVKDTATDIYIRQGTCLNKESADSRINEIIKTFL